MSKRKSSLIGHLIRLPLYLVVLWLLGFIFFYARVPQDHPPAQVLEADGIIVLTGGPGRLDAGLNLLTGRAAKRMLISGVHPSVETGELQALTGAKSALFDCCIDLGRAAQNTLGNAAEARAWAHTHDFKRLIIVTSDFHMPRSLLVLRQALPGVELVAYPVSSGLPVHHLAKEYSKYLLTVLGQPFQRAPVAKTERAKT